MADLSLKTAAAIERIADPKVRAILGICQSSRKYPLDCVVDGGLLVLAEYITRLEESCPRT